MRSYKDIYTDYCNWLVEKTGDDSLKYETLLETKDKNGVNAYLNKAILEKCYDVENGLYFFCRFIIGDLLDIGYPTEFRYNSLLRHWDKLVKQHKKLCIMSARGHGKSVFFDQILNLYDMFLHKFRRVIVISSSQEQANSRLDELKLIIDNNEWLRSKKGNNWAREDISYNGGYVKVKGIESEILGQHVDRIVLDDILRTDNKISDQEIEDRVDMNLDPMLLNRDGQLIIVGTPKRATDIFATIFRRTAEDPKCPWKFYKFPAILDKDKKTLLCPDRFTWEKIMNKRLSMGSLKFSREYQLEFFSRDTSLFPSELIDPAKSKGKDMSLLMQADKRDPTWTFIGGIDVARSGKVSADYTVVIILAYNTVKPQKQIVHFWRKKGLKISEQAKYIADISARFKHPCFVVEQNNLGQEMIDELVDDHNIFLEPFVTTARSKDELIRFLVKSFEFEQITMPMGDENSRQSMRILEDELGKFCVTATPGGNEKFEGVGAHDDSVIALALANKGTQTVGVPFAVSSYREGYGKPSTDAYESLIRTSGSKESDLVTKIRLGLIE